MPNTLAVPRPSRPARRPAPGRRRRLRLYVHEARALLVLAVPIVLNQLGQVGMNTLDTVMVGPLGANALAAVGLGSALHMAVLMMSSGVLLGMAPLVSQAFGARRQSGCNQVLAGGLWLALLLSVPVVLFNLLGAPLAHLLGQPAELAPEVGAYMHALAWGVPPMLLFFAGRQYLEGMGLSRPAMVLTLLGLAVNFGANRVLIYGVPGWVPALGVVGSGWATTVVRWFMLAGMGVYLLRAAGLNPLRGVGWRPDWAMIRAVGRIGAPAGVVLGLEVGLFTTAAVLMGWFGPLELGTHQVTINIAATTFMVALGVSLAGSVRVGQHIGAGNPAAMRRSVVLTYALALLFMAFCALAFLLVPEVLLGLYTRDPQIIRLGSSLLLIAALFQLFDGGQVAGVCVLRGAADTRVPMLLAALAYWGIGLPVAYTLGFHTALGPVGIWIGLCAALASAAALLLWRVRRQLWRGRRVAAVAPL